MQHWIVGAALAAVFVVASGHAKGAVVNCNAGQTISAAITKIKPATGYVTINVSGACSDNIYIPPDQAIHLIAANGATLAPANASTPTVTVEGRLQVDNLTVSTGSLVAIYINRGGFATVLAGTISGTAEGIEVSDNSAVLIEDSTITTSGSTAVKTDANGTVDIQGVANVFGRNAATITATANTGLVCVQGNVTLSTYGNGTVDFTGNAYGLLLTGCNLRVEANANYPVTVEKTGTTGQYSTALSIQGGSAILNGLQVQNNNDIGLNVFEGASVELNGAGLTVTGNSGLALISQQNGVIHIVPNGVNTISEPNGNNATLFNCYQGGKIYVDQIANTITPPPTKANIGCLTVGGP